MDYLKELEKYKDFKDVKDFTDDIHKLREYYSTGQYDAMQQHINKLTIKYLAETIIWNSTSTSMPTNPSESYNNAENFLRLKGYSILIKKGIKPQKQLTHKN